MPKERLYMRIERNLNEAAQRYAEDHGGISKSAVISQALAEFLRNNGYLPPLPLRPGEGPKTRRKGPDRETSSPAE